MSVHKYLLSVTLMAVLFGSGCAADPGDTSSEQPASTTTEALTASVTYRRGTAGLVTDTFVSASDLKESFGDSDKLRVSAQNEALIRFDLSSIPAGAVINSATLALYLNGGDNEADDDCADGDREGFPVIPIKLYRVTAPWIEASATYANFGQHFDPSIAGVILPTSANVFKSVDVKPLVQQWVSGSSPNDGIVLRTTAKRHTIFVSSEGKPSLRPSLTLIYTTPDDHCASHPCQHDGTCQNDKASFTCACAPGYSGATCETVVNNCASQPCQNGGACVSTGAAYSCTCVAGYSGSNCQTNIDDCAPTPCLNGGICTDGINAHTCACTPGYTGANCEAVIDNCLGHPCQNGGTCANGVNTFTCNCAPGFSGATCATLTDNCAGSPCQNGGTCANGLTGYTCSCASGYTGANCEIDVNDCSPNPCVNGGLCADGVNSYACSCPAGFSGPTCETNIDDCAGAPCHNGGSCLDGVDSFACNCAPGWGGVTCDTPLDACATNPCQNGGTCANNPATFGAFTCACAWPWGGPRCSADLSNGVAVTVPSVSSSPTSPHPILAGVSTTLKGVSRGNGTQYSWDFGDGSPNPIPGGWLNITDAFSLSVKHVYNGAVGQIFIATLSVHASINGPTTSAAYPMQIQDPTAVPDPRIAVAIDEALWDLHSSLSRGAFQAGDPGFGHDFASLSGDVAAGCAAAAAFERHGSLATGSVFDDPYDDDVSRLAASLFSQLTPLQAGAFVDLNGNGIMLGYEDDAFGITPKDGYCADALAHLPRSFAAPVGVAQVVGRMVGDIAQDLADGLMSQQSADGSWYEDVFASMSAAQALDATRQLGAVAPTSVLAENVAWIGSHLSAASLPACGSIDLAPYDVISTAAYVYESRLAGVPASEPALEASLGFINRSWTDATAACSSAEFMVDLALRAASVSTLAPRGCDGTQTDDGFDWYASSPQGFAPVLVARQQTDGSWSDSATTPCADFASTGQATALSTSILLGL